MATTKKKLPTEKKTLPAEKKVFPDASRISLTEAKEWFRSQKPASGHPASCSSCSWGGELGECKEKSLGESGTGWSWHCPKCGSQVMQYAFVILK
jgi:hypothetical protein